MTDSAHDLLAPDTGMGAVTLRVGDLDAMIAYYRDGVTLELIANEGGTAVLGRGTTPIIILQHAPELKAAEPRSAGLFHTAIVFDSQTTLALAIHSVATRYPGTFIGSADHLVSEAFYFTDPEGNGVELYWDRARTTWSWTHGQVEMATLYLDPNAYLQEHITAVALEAAAVGPVGTAVVGHVHLSVGDVASARTFYVDKLGFETTAEIGGSALFVSAGGYHHHMAMNTWNSAGAGRRGLALGLGQVDIVVPSADDIGALDERMRHYGVKTRDDGRTVAFEDPWANAIRVTVAAPSAR
ncbi:MULTISPECIES: VOC family protein [unclassified Leifsonia]|uniref:VOC family protein n=1 Tax=unclassified Leifsonia TaxID=2663824 RepID=UPI0006F75088|nr:MULTISPECIES: VOC family protein [unclassified Leifsonia]KQX08305.1 glyoxalase [Leifsonia sp. Root1293]KRA12587.1 glyoxalase [Leifsonia sp. Root60]